MTMGLPPKLKSLSCVAAMMAAATAPPAASRSAARAPLDRPRISGCWKRVQRVPGVAVPAVSWPPAAICFTELPARSSTLPDCVETTVLPHSTSTMKTFVWLLSATAAPSLVVTVALTPDEDETRTRPDSSMALTPVSLKLSLRLDSGKTSTRPSLPRLTTALEPLAVVTVLSEKTVAPEMALVPLTETSPTTERSPVGPVCPCCGAANPTIEYVHRMATARASEMGVRLQVLLVITSPPVGETVNFLRERAASLSALRLQKTRLRRFDLMFFSPIRLGNSPRGVS